MTNPFPATFPSICANCGDEMYEGDDVYAHEGEYVCEMCADELEIKCPECDGYKQPDMEICFTCKRDEPLEVW